MNPEVQCPTCRTAMAFVGNRFKCFTCYKTLSIAQAQHQVDEIKDMNRRAAEINARRRRFETSPAGQNIKRLKDGEKVTL